MIKAGIIVFPGTNCDEDTKRAAEEFGWSAEFIFHTQKYLDNFDILFLPGGFSYGDYVAVGRLAKFSPVMEAVKDYINKKRGLVVGICNGFQILCEAGLLRGALIANEDNKFISETVSLFFEGKKIKLPIANHSGRYFINENEYEYLKAKDMIFLEYENNPNGSSMNIAGIFDREKNIIGMMPHPERAIFNELNNIDGRKIFEMIQGKVNDKRLIKI